MSITTYAELKTAMANWLRPGSTLAAVTTARLPEFIALFEGELNGTAVWIGKEIETALTCTVGSSIVSTPADYESPVALWLESFSPRKPLTFTPPAELPYVNLSDYPTYWTIKGGNIALDRNAGSNYPLTFRYRQSIALSDANPTNTVLTNYPSLYLYGSLLQSAPFVRDAEMMAVWQRGYDRAEARMQAAENLSKSLVRLPVDAGLLPRILPVFNINGG